MKSIFDGAEPPTPEQWEAYRRNVRSRQAREELERQISGLTAYEWAMIDREEERPEPEPLTEADVRGDGWEANLARAILRRARLKKEGGEKT